MNSLDIRLKISPAGAYRIYDDFSEKEIMKHEDGSFTVTASMPVGEWLSDSLSMPYIKDENGKLIIVKEEAEIVRLIYDLLWLS